MEEIENKTLDYKSFWNLFNQIKDQKSVLKKVQKRTARYKAKFHSVSNNINLNWEFEETHDKKAIKNAHIDIGSNNKYNDIFDKFFNENIKDLINQIESIGKYGEIKLYISRGSCVRIATHSFDKITPKEDFFKNIEMENDIINWFIEVGSAILPIVEVFANKYETFLIKNLANSSESDVSNSTLSNKNKETLKELVDTFIDSDEIIYYNNNYVNYEDVDNLRYQVLKSLEELLKKYLDKEISLLEFKKSIDGLNKRTKLFGFEGMNGQMFFNGLYNESEKQNKIDKLDTLLLNILFLPKSYEESTIKINNLINFVQELRNNSKEISKTPQIGRILYFLSYFWHIQDPFSIQIVQPSIKEILEELEILKSSDNIATYYITFQKVNQEILNYFKDLLNEDINLYYIDHVFYFYQYPYPEDDSEDKTIEKKKKSNIDKTPLNTNEISFSELIINVAKAYWRTPNHLNLKFLTFLSSKYAGINESNYIKIGSVEDNRFLEDFCKENENYYNPTSGTFPDKPEDYFSSIGQYRTRKKYGNYDYKSGISDAFNSSVDDDYEMDKPGNYKWRENYLDIIFANAMSNRKASLSMIIIWLYRNYNVIIEKDDTEKNDFEKDQEVFKEFLKKFQTDFHFSQKEMDHLFENDIKELFEKNENVFSSNAKPFIAKHPIDQKFFFKFSKKEEYSITPDIEPIISDLKKIIIEQDQKQIILCGPPGTGKTYLAQVLAYNIAGERYEIVQFHPSFGYEDFVESIDISVSEDKKSIYYTPVSLIFRLLCEDAIKRNEDEKVVLIIDEINRGDISRIFGELIFGLESEYRGKDIQTALSRKLGPLIIPKNLIIIGTMNDVDRSIAFIDFALRRRFLFYSIMPEKNILRQYLEDHKIDKDLIEKTVKLFEILNLEIKNEPQLGKHHQIGHTYFFVKNLDGLKMKWNYQIIPLLEEYLNADCKRVLIFIEELEKKLSIDDESIKELLNDSKKFLN